MFFFKKTSGYVDCSFHKPADFFWPKPAEKYAILFFLRNCFLSKTCSGHMKYRVDNRFKIFATSPNLASQLKIQKS